MSISLRALAVLAAAPVALALPATAEAVREVDGAAQAHLRFIEGTSEDPWRLGAAGDVDGDGNDDLLVQHEYQSSLGEFGTQAVLWFGPLSRGGDAQDSSAPRVVVEPLPTSDPWREIHGAGPAGDVDGDGQDDLVVLPGTDRYPEDVEVLRGRGDRAAPSSGWSIGSSGSAVAAGDVNGDGLADLLVTARWPSVRLYVVFGKPGSGDVDLSSLGTGGFEIVHGRAATPSSGAAGDFNGDGLDDIIVGHRIVKGRSATTAVDPWASGSGWSMGSASAVRRLVAAGDVNGDGFDDLLVHDHANSVLVTLGSPSGTRSGWRVVFPATTELVPLAAAGDVDADGRRGAAGAAALDAVAADDAVVFGQRRWTNVTIGPDLGAHGFLVTASDIDGDEWAIGGGAAAAPAGEVTGDTRDDLVIGSYLVSGPPEPLGECTITGTGGNDVIAGTAGDDVICALGGADRVNASGGNDVVYGGAGNDTIDGGPGGDTLIGGEGGDIVVGGDGHDRMGGSDGADRLDGGAGDDRMSGGLGGDTAYGRAGADNADGQAGNDVLDGGDGGDVLRGGAGDDRALGRGDDDLLEGGPGTDRLEGAAGFDNLTDDGTDPGNDLLYGGPDGDRLHGGGTGTDRLEGDDGDDDLYAWGTALMYGEWGDDRLQGWGGAQRLHGGRGDDHLSGGDGRDRLYGEYDDDHLHSQGDGAADIDSCGPGIDEVLFDSGLDTVAADCETKIP